MAVTMTSMVPAVMVMVVRVTAQSGFLLGRAIT